MSAQVLSLIDKDLRRFMFKKRMAGAKAYSEQCRKAYS